MAGKNYVCCGVGQYVLSGQANWRHDTQHNDIQRNDIQRNDIQHCDTQRNDIQHYDTPHCDIQHKVK